MTGNGGDRQNRSVQRRGKRGRNGDYALRDLRSLLSEHQNQGVCRFTAAARGRTVPTSLTCVFHAISTEQTGDGWPCGRSRAQYLTFPTVPRQLIGNGRRPLYGATPVRTDRDIPIVTQFPAHPGSPPGSRPRAAGAPGSPTP